MKITIAKEVIVDALQKIQSIVNTRTTLPILSNVLLKAEGKSLTLATTDLEVSVQKVVEANIKEGGATTLPARRLFSIVKELAGTEIQLDVDEKNMATIKSGASVFKIIGIAEDEFPPIPELKGGKAYTLDQGVFRAMLRNTNYASSTDETRHVLNGVLLSLKGDKVAVVATDGRRLALVEQELEFPKGSEGDFIIPSKTVDELIKTLGSDGELKIKATEHQITFEFSDMLVVSKLIEGTYPNFRQVIPKACEERVPIERETLMTAARRASLLASDKSNSVKLTFAKNRLEIMANTPEVGEARETIPVKYGGKEITIAFNPDYIIDPLRQIDGDEVYVELTDDLSPGVIKCDVPFLYVLMPMRTS